MKWENNLKKISLIPPQKLALWKNLMKRRKTGGRDKFQSYINNKLLLQSLFSLRFVYPWKRFKKIRDIPKKKKNN